MTHGNFSMCRRSQGAARFDMNCTGTTTTRFTGSHARLCPATLQQICREPSGESLWHAYGMTRAPRSPHRGQLLRAACTQNTDAPWKTFSPASGSPLFCDASSAAIRVAWLMFRRPLSRSCARRSSVEVSQTRARKLRWRRRRSMSRSRAPQDNEYAIHTLASRHGWQRSHPG